MYKNNKGQILVLVAISLVVLIGFAALAIDVGYFYHTKNQLQGAADAAALAGVVKLDGTNDLTQTDARNGAITYAALNSASGSPVQLSSDNTNILSSSNDITVGSWITNTYTAGGTPVNALQVRARRTNKDAAGFPRIFGKIFDTTKQEIRPQAIATKPARSSIFISLCSLACGTCIGTECTISPPRVLDTQTKTDDDSQFAWTSLTETNTNAKDVGDMICGASPAADNCGNTISSTNGTLTDTLRNLESAMYDPNYESTEKEKDASGKITGWKVIVPVIAADQCPPGSQPDPKQVVYYAHIRIKAICVPGTYGCRGNFKATNMGPDNVCKDPSTGYKKDYSESIVIDSIKCVQCPDPEMGYKPVLVK